MNPCKELQDEGERLLRDFGQAHSLILSPSKDEATPPVAEAP
jgi:hypothetical protein